MSVVTCLAMRSLLVNPWWRNVTVLFACRGLCGQLGLRFFCLCGASKSNYSECVCIWWPWPCKDSISTKLVGYWVRFENFLWVSLYSSCPRHSISLFCFVNLIVLFHFRRYCTLVWNFMFVQRKVLISHCDAISLILMNWKFQFQYYNRFGRLMVLWVKSSSTIGSNAWV